jgi:hypothetical protein
MVKTSNVDIKLNGTQQGYSMGIDAIQALILPLHAML